MENNMTSEMGTKTQGEGYGKRPVWQWIVFYLAIAAVAYGLVYYFLLMPRSSIASSGSNTSSGQQSGLYGNSGGNSGRGSQSSQGSSANSGSGASSNNQSNPSYGY